MPRNDLKAVERRAFRSVVDTGLVDVIIASVLMMFAVAPLLSVPLGDFWSAAIFLPVYAALFLTLRVVRERVIVPRVGRVRFGPARTKRLLRFNLVMLTVNVVALVLSLLSYTAFERGAREVWGMPVTLSLTILLFLSFAGYFLNIPRFFFYGVVLAGGAMVGEWLFRQGYASHHGFPMVFGIAAITIAAVGLIKLAVLVRSHAPVAGDEL